MIERLSRRRPLNVQRLAGDCSGGSRPGGYGPHLILHEPALFERLPEAQASAMEHDPAVVLRNAQLRADLLGAQTLNFSEVEGTRSGGRKARQAAFHRFPELLGL